MSPANSVTGKLETYPHNKMRTRLIQRGFLPTGDPARRFPASSELGLLDELGRDLPSLLEDSTFRERARNWQIPPWPKKQLRGRSVSLMRLYYVRLGFLASAYVNQVGQPPVKVLPRNIAVPLCEVCNLLGRPPILSYDGYALYNWKRINPTGPIALGNIDTLQNFVHLYDEHWFILVHVEIEVIAADILKAIAAVRAATGAQSSIMPTLVAFMKVPHQQSALTDHLDDMRRFMPDEHRAIIGEVEAMPSIRPWADRDAFNEVLEAMATFREVHYSWAEEYINRRVADPRGTGGTPYMTWLKQLIDETRAHMMEPSWRKLPACDDDATWQAGSLPHENRSQR